MRLPLKSLLLLLALTPAAVRSEPAPSLEQRYRAAADRILQAATQDTTAYERLGKLVDTFGPRFSGSENLEHAIDWALSEMKKDGLEHVRGEQVMVPHWVRGAESAELLTPRRRLLPMLGIGGSVGTPAKGVTADVLVVNSFEDLKAHAGQARGKIVLFDVPFTSYRDVVPYRWAGASAASKAGAVASLLRSVGSMSLQTPHTGAMKYEDGVIKIPHAAITAEDAALLHRMQDRGEHVSLKLEMGAQLLPDVPSRNVVAELPGSEKPNEVVVVSGHFDSWDVGQGALDDGGGSVAAWEAVRLIKRLGLHPRRTIRVVLWVNEENGLRGGIGYGEAHAAELEKHIAAIETDNGVSKPTGFRFAGLPAALDVVKGLAPLFGKLGADTIAAGDPEADIHPIVDRGVPGLSLSVDGSKYFWFHHTDADTLDKVNPQELAQCVAALAIMTYTLADMPERLPHELKPATPPGK
jgi:carboxypeptidase Q